MRTIIFYASRKQLTPDHQTITAVDGRGHPLPPAFIRTEVISGDLEDGLEQAKPLDGETVLNSWSLYGQD